jgi:sortase (surface protein transpeptidase)
MTWGRRRFAAGAAVLALFLGGACSGGSGPLGRPAGPARPASQAAQDPPADGAAAVEEFQSVRGYQPTPLPIRVTIPKIRVTSSLERLGKDSKGGIVAPHQWAVAGWYALGPRPGEPAAAVILGHVDSKKSGPAVFFRLRELRPGDLVAVTRQDGSTVRFVVDRTEQYLKKQFPTEAVYFPTLTPTLRLVTCGGEFDWATGHYRSNFIVFASLAP